MRTQFFALSLSLFLWISNCQLEPDKQILIDFYNGMLEGSFTWDTQMSLCGQIGIICESDRVTEIHLSQLSINSTIPTEFGLLSQLLYLNLEENLISGTIPIELGNLSLLTNLDLEGNYLQGTIPTQLGKLSSVIEFDLEDNLLTGTIPTELGLLANMDELVLEDNLLTGSIPTEFGLLTKLAFLVLDDNKLNGTIPTELGLLASTLLEFDIEDNFINGTIPTELGKLVFLEILDLENNYLCGTIPTELGKLHNLTYLSLYYNEVTGTIPIELGLLSALRHLDLARNLLSGVIPFQLANVPLNYLYLENNQLIGNVPTEFSAFNLSAIKIYLRNNFLICPVFDYSFGNTIFSDYSFYDVGCENCTCEINEVCSVSGEYYQATCFSSSISCAPDSGFPLTQSGEMATVFDCPMNQYGSRSRNCSSGYWGPPNNQCQTCKTGYTSPANSPSISSCVDIDECLTNNGGCSMNAKCTNTIGSRTCSCNSGFSGNGVTCTDINECLTANGNCLQGTCINTPGSRTCSCFPGYTNDDGGRCVDLNECRTNNGGCDPKAFCYNTIGSRNCTCPSGYTGDGLVCNDINECLTNNGGCESFAICVNTIGSKQCNCPPGYLGNGYDCSNRKLLHYAKFSPLTRFSFDTSNQDEVRIGIFANVGSAQRFSIYQRNIPGNQAMRLDGDDNIIIPPVNLNSNFTFDVVFNTNTYPTSPTLSDILTVMPQGKSLRSEASLIISIDSNGKIIRSSNGVVIATSGRIVRTGVSHSLMVSFTSGRLITHIDGINLGTINFNNHVAGNPYEIQSGMNFDGYIDEIGAYNMAMGVNFLYSVILCKNPCPSNQVCVNLLNGESCAQRVF